MKYTALYVQICAALLEDIRAGKYSDGQRLPTEKELSETYFVSRITAKKAMDMLADQGYIERHPGRGSFVKNSTVKHPIIEAKNHARYSVAFVAANYTTSFGLELLKGAIDAAQKQDVDLVVKNTCDSKKNEDDILDSLIGSGKDAIILQPMQGEVYSKQILEAAHRRVPIVMLDRYLPGLDMPCVCSDNHAAARAAVNKMIELGHRHIAMLVMGSMKSTTIVERTSGFIDAFLENRLVVDRSLWVTSDQIKKPNARSEDFVRAFEQLMKTNRKITAVFSTEYSGSQVACRIAREMGLRIPEDLSVVGFDCTVDITHDTVTPLSYVKQPQYEMGYKAVELACELIRNRDIHYSRFVIPCRWEAGATLAPPRASDPE